MAGRRASSTACRSPSEPGPRRRARRGRPYLILGRGRSERPALRQDERGILRYGADDVVASSTRSAAGDARRASRSSATVAEALAFGPTTAVVGVATAGGRFPPAWRELLKQCIAARARRRERPARVRQRGRGAGRAGARARRRAARPAQAAGTGSTSRPARTSSSPATDRADRRLGLRDREEDRRARARPRGAPPRARARCSSRPARPGSRSPAGGSRSTPSSPTSSPARPSGWSSRAPTRRRAALRRGPGLARRTRPTRA